MFYPNDVRFLLLTVAPILLLAALQVPSADFLCDPCFLVASYTASWQSVIMVVCVNVMTFVLRKKDVVNMFFFRLSVGKSTWRSSFFWESIWITSTGCQQLRLVTEYIIHSDRSFSQIVEWEVGKFGEKTCESLMETLVGPSWLLQVAAMLAFDVSYHELQLHV